MAIRAALPLRRAFGRILSEMIDGPQRITRRFNFWRTPFSRTYDGGTTDYAFWDRARNGQAKGLEVSGLLLKPLNSKVASWVLGQPPKFKVGKNTKAAEELNRWWAANHASMLAAYEEAVALGDSFVAINPDLTPTLIPPNVVKPKVARDDFSQVTGWTTEEVYPYPGDVSLKQTIRWDYTTSSRTKTISENGVELRSTRYSNLLGRLQLIHIANNRKTDERFGRPEGEPLIPLLHRYGQIFDAAVEGNIRQGRPTPVVERMGDSNSVQKFWDRYKKQQVIQHPDGTTQTLETLEWDADQFMTLPNDATFKWASPNSFTGDTQVLLQLMFYLYLQHTELPEWVLGNAIASSQASANTQVEPLVKFIEKKQGLARGWIMEVAEVVLGYLALFDPALAVDQDDIELTWEPLTNEDGTLTVEAIKFAFEAGLLDAETALKLLPLRVENPADVIQKAQKEKQEQQGQFDQTTEQAIRDAEQRARQQQADQQKPPDMVTPQTQPQPNPQPQPRRAAA